MTMPLWAVILIIVLALAVIFSNVMLVKKTANMKMPDILNKQGKKVKDWQSDEWDENNWEDDDWGEKQNKDETDETDETKK
ncbi:hypothetical protein CWE08_03260 [Aliidiomarina iranensis]|uniref:DUF2897 domain-containing protein n=1 Tax=Aliidiomarina iranensis TaxID=1434071 RepID=A0A432VZP2_9GAMM|nr:DUF2897 family protein [Aliidiomarina iranensis]RUO22220.1 hypothetical protein CWE08_03260 [Aliidiomarina iranensis]